MAPPNPITEAAAKLAEKHEADVYLFSHQINEAEVDKLISQVRSVAKKRTNVILVLTTDGGDPDAAFQMARCLKRFYKKLLLFVFGHCKSAGTLVAIAADEIVMSEFGHFGPLDIQLSDNRELLGRTPALEVAQALATLADTASEIFRSHFYQLGPGRALNTKTASEIAIQIALGVIEPIAAQIDPILLGRVERSMRIATEYSRRLNPSFDKIEELVRGYFSHSFVIDFEEAKAMFGPDRLREPTDDEKNLEKTLRGAGVVPMQSSYTIKLSTDAPVDAPKASDHENSTSTHTAGFDQPASTVRTEGGRPEPLRESSGNATQRPAETENSTPQPASNGQGAGAAVNGTSR